MEDDIENRKRLLQEKIEDLKQLAPLVPRESIKILENQLEYLNSRENLTTDDVATQLIEVAIEYNIKYDFTPGQVLTWKSSNLRNCPLPAMNDPVLFVRYLLPEDSEKFGGHTPGHPFESVDMLGMVLTDSGDPRIAAIFPYDSRRLQPLNEDDQIDGLIYISDHGWTFKAGDLPYISKPKEGLSGISSTDKIEKGSE